MKRIKKLCIVTNEYPTDLNPGNAFVDQLVIELSEQGIECNVISPYSLTKHWIREKIEAPPRSRVKTVGNGNIIRIFSPRFFSFSDKHILGVNTVMMTLHSFKRAVLQEYKRIRFDADAFYGHFIYPTGLAASELGIKFHKPSYIAYGESSIDVIKNVDRDYVLRAMDKVNGIIAVSRANKTELLKNGIIEKSEENKIGVFPNAVNNNRFFLIDKQNARREFGFPKESFIVAFVGHFIERKGIGVLSSALKSFKDVYSIFIGQGPLQPTCSNILFKGRLKHEQIYKYLNAADVFVLPTLAEGCCNAIIEAMACGLPIISSNQSFNDDILNSDNSIRVDVNSIDAITDAIQFLKNNPIVRAKMSNAALHSASNLSIKQRTQNIIRFMESKIQK
ncbi:glycosyltransferase [Pelotomaculum propionicicum]|uniref:glycosyltransferase n=1 Tax=Pelotomaculum propionicicum TaxID=258475 RepID=UPI003B7E69B5